MSVKKYSLRSPDEDREKDFTVLHHRKFSFKRLAKHSNRSVSLWNISPARWPGSPGSILAPKSLGKMISSAYDYTRSGGHLVVWMPSRELHRTEVDLLRGMGKWTVQATILSGSDKGMSIGYIYSKGPTPIEFDSEMLLDECDKRGPSSSHAMRFLLDNLVTHKSGLQYEEQIVVEPSISRSGQMALWSRRSEVKYIGYTTSETTFEVVKEKLAQVELPGIQVRLPAT